MLAIACVIAFVGVLLAAYWVPAGRWADGWAIHGLLGLQRPWLNTWASRVVHLADVGPFVAATAALVGVALMRDRPRHAAAVVVLLAGSSVTSQVLKAVLAHPRHHAFLGHAQLDAASYPSGHATASMALAFAALLVAPRVIRPLVALVGALFTLAISESAMLLAWHFPSDIIGGYLLATVFACLTVAALGAAAQRWPERTVREAARRALAGTVASRLAAGTALALAGGAVGAAVAERAPALQFADRHTTAALAVVAVAAMAAALPAAVAALSFPRA